MFNKKYTLYVVSAYKPSRKIFANDTLQKSIKHFFNSNFKKNENNEYLLNPNKKDYKIYIYKIECKKYTKSEQSYYTGLSEIMCAIDEKDVIDIDEFKSFENIESLAKYSNFKITNKDTNNKELQQILRIVTLKLKQAKIHNISINVDKYERDEFLSGDNNLLRVASLDWRDFDTDTKRNNEEYSKLDKVCKDITKLLNSKAKVTHEWDKYEGDIYLEI